MWRTFFNTWGGHPTAPVDQLAEPLGIVEPPNEAAGAAERPLTGTMACPDLIGMSSQDARRVARLSDLFVEVEERAASLGLVGRAIGQSPAPGANVAVGEAITVAIGAKPHVIIPDVRDIDELEALATLRETGLVPARRVGRPSDHVPEGAIIRTRPRHGSSVAVGTRVTYVVAAAPRRRARQRRRDPGPVRVRRLPDGTFLSMPEVD